MLNINQPIDKLTAEQLGPLYREAREIRLAMNKKVEAVEEFEKACLARIVATVPVGKGFIVDGYSYAVINKEVPSIDDWDKVLAYIGETGRFDFLRKQLADKAVTDTENWHKIPGIKRFNTPKLSVTKR